MHGGSGAQGTGSSLTLGPLKPQLTPALKPQFAPASKPPFTPALPQRNSLELERNPEGPLIAPESDLQLRGGW